MLGRSGVEILNHRCITEAVAKMRQQIFSIMNLSKSEFKSQWRTLLKESFSTELAHITQFYKPGEKFLFGYLTLADFELEHLV